jgi:spore coat polysaccharide biosynthesis predicted glycosyltransferase SpsG
MPASAEPAVRALFRVAAGSRLGFGHLVRCRALARALDVVASQVSLRGAAHARRTARRFGLRLVAGSPHAVLRRVRPDVLIIDDPSRAAAASWCRAARALRVPVVSIHDLGKAFCGADLAIDGSIVIPGSAPRGLLSGTQYAVLDSSVCDARGMPRDPNSILIALGGGPRVGLALRIAEALRDARSELRVRIAGGFAGRGAASRYGIVCLGPQDGLAAELARCAVAVTGGGVSLYEAAALDTPVVSWPVVAAQHRTVVEFQRRGLATTVLPGPRRVARVVNAVLAAIADTSRRRSSEAVDGLGAARVAAAIRTLIGRRSRVAA